jgi:hypothetical protein
MGTARGVHTDQWLGAPARRPFSRERLSAAKTPAAEAEAEHTFTEHDQPNGERRNRIRPTNAELRDGGKPDEAEECKECADRGEEAVGAECAAAETDRNASLQECKRRLHDE